MGKAQRQLVAAFVTGIRVAHLYAVEQCGIRRLT
ncbi:unknown [Clostridium sp. CAG:1024]|nr:unknown [Clostridium sp. CAG:1024]